MTETPSNDVTLTPDNDFSSGAQGYGANDDTGIGTTPEETEPGRQYGQEDVDKIVQRRLKRQETKLRQELQEQAAEEARKARMDETERLKEEKRIAVESAKAREKAADDRVKLAEAKAQAAALGVPQESLLYVGRLVKDDLADIDIDVDGTPDTEAIQAAVKKAVDAISSLAKREEPQEETPNLTMPTGRDRSPAPSSGVSSNGPSTKDLFNQRLRNRTSQR